MCLFYRQFVVRSENVIEIKESATSNTMASSLCDDVNLTWNPSPLVWPEAVQYHACALTGGYDMTVRHQIGNIELCPSNWLKPRLESECMPGDGISIDFRHFDCRGDLSMAQEQQLRCLGSWTDGHYAYSVLTDADDLWPKLWMFRLPVKRGASFTAELLSDIRVERGAKISQTVRYHLLEMTRRPFPSLCADEAVKCDDCTRDTSDLYCQKSCRMCVGEPAARNSKACVFPSETRGMWEEINAVDSRLVNISESGMSTSGLETLRCLELRVADWYGDTDRQALSVVYPNGCRPRFACAQLVRVSPSVLRYRLSEARVWPFSVSLNAADVCAQTRFTDTALSGSRRLKTLVSTDPTVRQTVSCGLNASVEVRGNFDGGKKCHGRVNPCGTSDDVITLELRGESCPEVTRFRCLASFVDDSTQIVVTEREGATRDVHCWMFHSGAWNAGERVLYILHTGECNADSAYRIDYGAYKGHLARLVTSHQSVCGDTSDVPGPTTLTSRVYNPRFNRSTSLDGEPVDTVLADMAAGSSSSRDVIGVFCYVSALLVLALSRD